MTKEHFKLQKQIVAWLFFLEQRKPSVLRQIAVDCKTHNLQPKGWVDHLRSLGFLMQYEPWNEEIRFGSLISEQIEEADDGSIFIRNLLGTPLSDNAKVIELKSKRRWQSTAGCLRTASFANPRMVRIDDVIATGERIISEPREGADGQILVHVEAGSHGVWIPFPPEFKIELRPKKAPVSASSALG